MFNQERMQQMMWDFIAKQMNKMPPELRRGLTMVQLDVVRYPDRILIVANAPETNAEATYARQSLLDGLSEFLPEYVSRVFEVKVRIFKK